MNNNKHIPYSVREEMVKALVICRNECQRAAGEYIAENGGTADTAGWTGEVSTPYSAILDGINAEILALGGSLNGRMIIQSGNKNREGSDLFQLSNGRKIRVAWVE